MLVNIVSLYNIDFILLFYLYIKYNKKRLGYFIEIVPILDYMVELMGTSYKRH